MKLRMVLLAGLTLQTVSAQAQPVWNNEQLMHVTLASHPLVLGKLLNTTPESWLRMQQTLDLWQLERRGGYVHIRQLAA